MHKQDIIIVGAGTAGLTTALLIREKYPYASIKIVRSKELGIIGVGEGSTEHWDEFINLVGISHIELIKETSATIKIGILFNNWSTTPQYVHSVGQHYTSAFRRMETYNNLVERSVGLFPLSPEFERVFFKNNVTLTSNLKPSNQYHFDTFKLNAYLCRKCEERSIEFVDALVTDVQLDDQGFVSKLKLDNGAEEEAFFYIDCSGFKRVLSSKVDVKWKSYNKYLPMNHAIAFPTEFEDPRNIEPYTTASALSSGWVWKIPTQERYGNGYVFCDSFIDSDQALGEVSKHLNKNIEKAARDIKFEVGRVDSFWKKNVVCIGLASSFAEPLEAQSIGFSILQASYLIDLLDTWYIDNTVSEKYNETMIRSFDNIINYLQMHYMGDRQDSEFWKQKPLEVTEFNKHVIKLAKEGIVDTNMFDGTYLMFRGPNWYQVLAGLNILSKEKVTSLAARNRDNYNSSHINKTQNHLNDVHNMNVINHRDYINLVKLNFEYRNENRNSFAALG